MKPGVLRLLAITFVALFKGFIGPVAAAPEHAIAMHGDPKYARDFAQFDYVNPAAPKGGVLTIAELGSFDTLNPLSLVGNSAKGIGGRFGLVYESLLTRSADEPFSLYGLIAQAVEAAPDRSWVAFTLNPNARFSDGTPVTVQDVIFSFETLRDKGRPNHRLYYSRVASVEVTDDSTIRFTFKEADEGASNWELPLIMGLMPILSKAHLANTDFTKRELFVPIGSGPYVIENYDFGKQVRFQSNPDYWGRHLAVNKDRHNFERVQIDYYRDESTLFEAFKVGKYDVRFEPNISKWKRGYTFSAIDDKRILLNEVRHDRPTGMYGLAFNSRRSPLADKRTRQAIALLFDFEWINQNYFFGSYSRTQSFFSNSELSAREELTPNEHPVAESLTQRGLSPFTSKLARSPTQKGFQNSRTNRRQALALLKEAGWIIRDQKLVHEASDAPFVLELMIKDLSMERVALFFAQELEKVGINLKVRLEESGTFNERIKDFDFDVVPFLWPGTLSPGNEQAFRWSSQSAETKASWNLPGVRDQTVDALIDEISGARTREHLVAATRLLDRQLLNGHYVIPLYHTQVDRFAHHRDYHFPKRSPRPTDLTTWWYEEVR